MEIRVLGPLEIVADDEPVPLRALKQRRLLAALVVRAGETRSVDALIDAVWGEFPPSSAAKLLQVYVSQLRKALPAGAPIRTRGSGYALELDDKSLDAARFERLLAEGRAALQEGNAALAASLLTRGLALWRGDAYGELAYEEFARAEAERLEELRLAALEERIESQLQLGRHRELLAEVGSFAAAHPVRERLQAQAMLALYRSGRQSEALEVYAAARVHLHDELGLEPGAELRELQRRVLQQDPGLAAAPGAGQPLAALPVPPNALLGRDRELGELRQLLARDDVRLLVLTGAGGSGKTRLALQAARETAESFANGAAFVELAPLRDPRLVLGTIARALRVEEKPDQEPLETLAEALRTRELLLLIDNAEHLRATAPTYVELLAQAPRLTLLITSRVVLHLSGEHVYPVEPLPADAAIALFHERAHEADPRFHPDPDEEEAVRLICARLDGLPLAIEVAASRVRTLTPVELLARLDPRLPLLTGGPRDLPARQQTLRATLEWSFGLLDEEERRDLIHLAVFAGGCTLEAAEAVCGTTVDRLGSLVDHNLLRRTATADGSRYEMLETIREFALELLDELPESGEARRRHSDYFRQVAKRFRESDDLQRLDEPDRRTIQMFSDEIGNYRAALEWLLARGDVEAAAEIAMPLTQYWYRSAQPQEAVIWLERLLENEAALAPATRARIRSWAGSMLEFAGDRHGAHELYEQALRDARASGDEMSLHITLRALGGSAMERGEMEKARALLDESLSLSRVSANPMGLSLALATRGFLAREEGDREGVDRYFQEALVVARQHRTISLPRLLQALADFALEDGDIIRAARLFRESLAACVEGRMAEWIPWALGGIATTAAERGDLRAAGRVWGAGETLEQQRGRPIARVRDQFGARIRSLAKADPAAFEAAVEEGHRLPTDEAIRRLSRQPTRLRTRRRRRSARADR